MIEIRELTKFYGAARALGPISCDIAKGEVVGLLGLNGAGKTTTLRILACDLLPSSGSVRVDGLDVVEEPEAVRARIGYLPDTPPLYGDMTVASYLEFAARLRGVPRSELDRRVRSALDATETNRVRGSVISSLSHGFKQRVGIAQAIVHSPALLVLDEPISGLDPVQIVEMRALLRRLRGDHTILVSSHILTEISETCDRILVIRDGLIAAQGTEDDLVSSLGRGMRVEAVVRGEADDARAVIAAIDGVTACEIDADAAVASAVGSRESGKVSLVRISAERDVREAVARALVGANLGLLELRQGERELESVFIKLAGPTAGEKPTPNAPGGQA